MKSVSLLFDALSCLRPAFCRARMPQPAQLPALSVTDTHLNAGWGATTARSERVSVPSRTAAVGSLAVGGHRNLGVMALHVEEEHESDRSAQGAWRRG
jgi:hypothetical protein